MIKFYYHPSPNPAKVALFLEETGVPYEVVPIDTRKGSARPAAIRANALKDKFQFKTDMDVEARRPMFRHLSAR